MKTKEFPILTKPPIQEIVLGIGYRNYLSEPTDLQKICDLFLDQFPQKYPVFEMNFTKELTRSERKTIGHTLVNSSQTESLIIDTNRVTFIDRSKYQGFDPFYEKFIRIFRKINEFKAITTPINIGLKIVNKFFLDINEVNSESPKVKFLPQIALKYSDKDFASCLRTGGRYLLRDMMDSNLQSVVSTELQPLGEPPRFQAIFITDTAVPIEKIDETILKVNLDKMREFKNKIFFSNISENIKDFKK